MNLYLVSSNYTGGNQPFFNVVGVYNSQEKAVRARNVYASNGAREMVDEVPYSEGVKAMLDTIWINKVVMNETYLDKQLHYQDLN